MSTYESAKHYIDNIGWSLVRLPPRSKGDERNTKGWEKRREPAETWIDAPDDNIGLHLGFSGVVSFDIDNQEHTRTIFYNLGLDYDKVLEQCPRIVGRAGHDKALFRAPKDILLKTHKLSWPAQDDPKNRITIFELRAGAVQDVLPPSIHPDTGMPYTWKRRPECGIPELPKELLSIWKEWETFKHQLRGMCPWEPPREIPPAKKRAPYRNSESVIERFNASIDITTLLDRYGYVRKSSGRYLRPGSSTGIPGVIVFHKENRIFSHHGGEPFDTDYSHDAFDLFCIFEHNGNIVSAVKAASAELNIPTFEYDPEAIEHGRSVAETFLKVSTPEKCNQDDLLKVPGVLQAAVEYYQATAIKPQPEFAVACALAIGSVCMSRQWRSSQNNYTGLYFLLLGKSSTGKEHSKTVIETVLRRAGDTCMTLLGPPGYTSAGAIISTLKHKPRHICIQDEMGKQLQHAMSSKNSQKDAAYTMIMEAFGRQSGFLSSDAYSDLSGRKHDEQSNQTIDRPSITIFGISTPSTLYKAINTDSIASGYLPRFLIIESDAERCVSRWIDEDREVPADLLAWCAEYAEKTGDTGNLSAYTNPPEPVTLPFHPSCREMLEEYEKKIIEKQNKLDVFNISELLGRVKEISMRVALIVAGSCRSDMILPEHLGWSIRYVSKHFQNTTKRVRMVVSSSDFEAVCKETLAIIQTTGAKGATQSEIYKKSALIRALGPKDVDAVMMILQETYGIEKLNVTHGKAGRPRLAWVYPADEE